MFTVLLWNKANFKSFGGAKDAGAVYETPFTVENPNNVGDFDSFLNLIDTTAKCADKSSDLVVGIYYQNRFVELKREAEKSCA